jgi:hypothetical protein
VLNMVTKGELLDSVSVTGKTIKDTPTQ